MMPTTRRGRYIFYRARSNKRHRRARKNQFRPSFLAHHITARSYVTDFLRMQFPKAYGPHAVESPRPPFFWTLPGRIKPDYKLWGVVPNPLLPVPGWGPKTHFTIPIVYYAFRRLHHCPRLRHLARRPYFYTIAELPPFTGFPFVTYPSGSPNPRGWLP